MGLTAFVDALSAYLMAELSPAPKIVGASEPEGAAQLPAVTLSLAAVSSPHPGVGAAPGGPVTGALATSARIALDAPFLDSPTGRVPLLSKDRLTLQLPHGAIVRHDGTPNPPFDWNDLKVSVTDASGRRDLTVSKLTPAAGQVQPSPANGRLRFGSALPGTGTLDLSYFVGLWEVRSERFGGELRVEIFAGTAQDADALSRQVETALAPERSRRLAGLRHLAPTGWGAVGQTAGGPRLRTLTYLFDYEFEVPVVVTSGGPIQRVHVSSTPSVAPAPGTEQFDVTKK